jgi:hypothetical protein
MKTRNGFVSNSSSSSFVVIGRLIDSNKMNKIDILELLYTPEEIDNMIPKGYRTKKWSTLSKEEKEDSYYNINRCPFTILEGDDDGMPEGKICVGKCISHSCDEQMEFSCTDVKEVDKELKKAGLDGPIQVITGTRLS